jgi:hypothetical protein
MNSYRDGFKKVADFGDDKPTLSEVRTLIEQANTDPGVTVLELVIHPIWTGMLLDDVILPLDFRRVGSLCFNTVTRLRWQKTLRQTQATEEDQRLVKMNAGFNGLVK